jgi:hypothetical protein
MSLNRSSTWSHQGSAKGHEYIVRNTFLDFPTIKEEEVHQVSYSAPCSPRVERYLDFMDMAPVKPKSNEDDRSTRGSLSGILSTPSESSVEDRPSLVYTNYDLESPSRIVEPDEIFDNLMHSHKQGIMPNTGLSSRQIQITQQHQMMQQQMQQQQMMQMQQMIQMQQMMQMRQMMQPQMMQMQQMVEPQQIMQPQMQAQLIQEEMMQQDEDIVDPMAPVQIYPEAEESIVPQPFIMQPEHNPREKLPLLPLSGRLRDVPDFMRCQELHDIYRKSSKVLNLRDLKDLNHFQIRPTLPELSKTANSQTWSDISITTVNSPVAASIV